MTNMRKLLGVAGVLVFGVFGVLCLSNTVQAAPNLSVTPTAATYVVPHGSGSYTLNLWHGGMLQGTDSGTTGVLTVPVPLVTGCTFQADVLKNGQWFEGSRVTLSTCGPVVTTTTTSTTTTTTTVAPTTTTTVAPAIGSAAHGGSCYPVCSPAPSIAPTHPVKPSSLTHTAPYPLAFTGAPVGSEALLGTGLLIVGGGLMFWRRRGIRRA